MAGHLARGRPPRHGLQPDRGQGRRNGSPSTAARARRRRARPRAAPTSCSPASATTTTCARSTLGDDGAFAGMKPRRDLRRPHHRLGRRSRASCTPRRSSAALQFIDAPVSGGKAGAHQRRADGDVRRRRRGLRRGAAGGAWRSRKAVTLLGAERRRASSPRWSTRSRSPAWCRACPKRSPSASAPAST